MIDVFNAKKQFDDYVVFENVNLKIKDGSIFGLVGINGAGKSTLLRSIAGVYCLDEGTIFLDNQIIYENPKVKGDIMFLPDEPFKDLYVTGNKLKNMYKIFYTNFDDRIFNELMGIFKLSPKKRIVSFSKGMRRRLFLALAFAVKPKVLLLDEAFDGLDPLARLRLKKKMVEYVEEFNLTIIISSHSLRELEDICDSYAILDQKHIISSGVLEDNVSKYCKLQLAFNKEMGKNDFAFLKPLSLDIKKRVVNIVFEGTLEQYFEQINKLNPLFIDELPLNFEDFFISNVKEDE